MGEVLGGSGFPKSGEVLRLGVGFGLRIVEQLSLSMVCEHSVGFMVL